jgi:hypothetical protein
MEITIAPAQLTRMSHRYETGSQPMVMCDDRSDLYVVKFAEKAEHGTSGLARDYLAGPLSQLIEAPVPSTAFVELTTASLFFDSTIAFSDGSRPAPQVTVGSTFVPNAASPASPAAFQAVPDADIAGVLVFNTWVSVGDRHWGNYIIQTTTNGLRLISVDYATCLATHQSMPTSIGDVDLIPFARRARTAIQAYLLRLRAVTESQIRRAISGVPIDWMPQAERERIVSFLLSGRATTAGLIASALG